MSESPTAITEKPQSSPAARIGWTVLIIATLYVCYFSHLGAIGFVGPDEPRYAWIARDMAETGDWVTPRLYGKPWFEKPPLFYWGAALSFKLFGVSEAVARLPSAISALLATLALAWLALRLYGAETARWLLLLLPTSVGMIGFSHAAATDMPFSGMLTILMVCAAAVLNLTHKENSPILPRTPWLALILFGFFLGLAVLAKGPAGIILCGGAIFFWALFTKRWRDAFRLFHPAAIAAFCLTALPWYILCARRNPDFFRIFIIEHNFKRFLTPEFQHIQPFWFYIPVVLIAFLPWTVSLVCSLLSGSKNLWRNRNFAESSLFLLCWAGFCVAFFTISRSKLPGYVLPAIPAMGLLLARDLNRRLHQSLAHARWECVGVALTFAAMGVIGRLEGGKIPFGARIHPQPAVVRFFVAMVLVGMVIATLAAFRQTQMGLMIAAITLPTFLIFGIGDFGNLDAVVSARPAAAYAIGSLTPPELDGAVTFKLKRGLGYGLDFYLHRELKEWSPASGEKPIIFTSREGRDELMRSGVPCFYYVADPITETCQAVNKVPSGSKNRP